MEDLRILCKCCNNEVVKSGVCGCPNMASIRGDRISAIDMTKVILLTATKQKSQSSLFSPLELAEQEARRNRKVRRLDFEVR